jgi:hypothetical protein
MALGMLQNRGAMGSTIEGDVCRMDGTAYEVPFSVRVPADWREEALTCLPHGAILEETAGAGKMFWVEELAAGGFRTFAGDEVTGRAGDKSGALDQLRRDLMIHVANFAPSYVFVHAGVVAVNGHGLMMPGTSFAGKTTLVAELVRAGATYYSDEYAVIDEEGWVHPYSRELQMREVGGTAQRGVHVSALDGVAGGERVRISHVLFARYVPGGVWAPEPVSGGMAVLEMLRHSIPVQRTPGRVMAVLGKVVGKATAWQSERGDARAVVGGLIEAVCGGLPLG